VRALKFDDTGLFLLAGPVLSVVYQMSKLAKISKYAEGVQSEWPFGHSHIYSLAFLGFLFFFSNPSGFCLWFLCCTAKVRRAEAFMFWRLDSCQWAGAVRSTTMNYATWDFEIPIWDRMANVKILEKRSRYWLLFHFSIFFLLVTNGY